MENKAQFYLMAAIVIIIILVGISTITNYAVVKKSPVSFYDLSAQLGEESSRVIDYGIYNEENINQIIDTFAENFTSYFETRDRNSEIIFVYGNKNSATISTYKMQDSGDIKITFSGGEKYILMGNSQMSRTSSVGSGDNIKVILGKNEKEKEYEFGLKEGENFLFVIQKSEGGEFYVSKK